MKAIVRWWRRRHPKRTYDESDRRMATWASDRDLRSRGL